MTSPPTALGSWRPDDGSPSSGTFRGSEDLWLSWSAPWRPPGSPTNQRAAWTREKIAALRGVQGRVVVRREVRHDRV